jgi:hypothetical protein
MSKRRKWQIIRSPAAGISSDHVMTSGYVLTLFACFSGIMHVIFAVWAMESVALFFC